MMYAIRGNIAKKLFEANDPDLEKEWETLKETGTFHELVDFLHRIGIRCHERREELTTKNREKRT